MFQLPHNLLRHRKLILCFTESLPACTVVTTKLYSVYLCGRTYRLETIKTNNCFVYTRTVLAYNLYRPCSERRTLLLMRFERNLISMSYFLTKYNLQNPESTF